MVDRTITLFTEDGKELIADILFTYHSEEFEHDYVVFQIRESQQASAAIYVPSENGQGSLEKIESEEEWQLLEELLADYCNQDNEGCGGSCSGSCDSCGSTCGSCGSCDCGDEANDGE